MNVTYIHHSGFLIETEACYYLIDYFQGSIPALNPCKPVLVLAQAPRPLYGFQTLKQNSHVIHILESCGYRCSCQVATFAVWF